MVRRPEPMTPASTSGVVARWRPWLVLLAGVMIGVVPLVPPAVGDPSPTDFSTRRALAHIDWIAREPHPMGTEAIARVRDRLAAELMDMGLAAELQPSSAPDWHGGTARTLTVVNVLARLPGTASTGAVAIVGHYDTVPATPGANDNASAVAIMLETARVLASSNRLRNDVLFVFTDGEEPAPRFGSTAFVERHPWATDIEFVVNLESSGSGGPSLVTAQSGPSSWVIDRYVEAVPHPAAYSFLLDIVDLIGGSNTDFAPFRDAGVAGVEFAYLRGSSIYHTMADAPGSVGERSLHQHGENTLALVRHVGDLDLAERRGADAPVLFTVGWGTVIRFPRWLAVGFLVAAVLMVFAAIRTTAAVRRAVGAAMIALATIVLLSLLGVFVWLAVTRWRSDMGAAEGYVHLFMLTALLTGGLVATDRMRPSGRSAESVALLWLVLALATVPIGYGVSSLFGLPVFLAGVALGVRRITAPPFVPAVAEALPVFAAGVLMVPPIEVFFQFAQPRPGNPDSEVVWTVFGSLLLVALVVELAHSFGPAVAPISAEAADR